MWLTNDLKQEVKQVFEPRYKREISDEEVVDIANSLADFVEIYGKQNFQKERQ